MLLRKSEKRKRDVDEANDGSATKKTAAPTLKEFQQLSADRDRLSKQVDAYRTRIRNLEKKNNEKDRVIASQTPKKGKSKQLAKPNHDLHGSREFRGRIQFAVDDFNDADDHNSLSFDTKHLALYAACYWRDAAYIDFILALDGVTVHWQSDYLLQMVAVKEGPNVISDPTLLRKLQTHCGCDDCAQSE